MVRLTKSDSNVTGNINEVVMNYEICNNVVFKTTPLRTGIIALVWRVDLAQKSCVCSIDTTRHCCRVVAHDTRFRALFKFHLPEKRWKMEIIMKYVKSEVLSTI